MQTQSKTRSSVRRTTAQSSVLSAPSLPLDPQPSSSSDKQVTLRTLSALKRQLYSRASVGMQQQPGKAAFIQRRADSDAQHIAFVINMVSVKL